MLRFLGTVGLAVLLTPGMSAASPPEHFSCSTLLRRQAVPGHPALDVRMIEVTVQPGVDAHAFRYRHAHGAIVYLLSGQAASQTPDGVRTPLRADTALIVSPAQPTTWVATGSGPARVLVVQFTDPHSPAFTPVGHVVQRCHD